MAFSGLFLPATRRRAAATWRSRKAYPRAFLKIFPKLEKAGIVAAREGVRGGYRLAKPPEDITILAIVDAIEGDKPLFECQGLPKTAEGPLKKFHQVFAQLRPNAGRSGMGRDTFPPRERP